MEMYVYISCILCVHMCIASHRTQRTKAPAKTPMKTPRLGQKAEAHYALRKHTPKKV